MLSLAAIKQMSQVLSLVKEGLVEACDLSFSRNSFTVGRRVWCVCLPE